MRAAISLKKRFQIFKRDNYRCSICGVRAGANTRLEVDHKFPIARGGSDDFRNLWTLCFDCNRGKSDSTIEPETKLFIELVSDWIEFSKTERTYLILSTHHIFNSFGEYSDFRRESEKHFVIESILEQQGFKPEIDSNKIIYWIWGTPGTDFYK